MPIRQICLAFNCRSVCARSPQSCVRDRDRPGDEQEFTPTHGNNNAGHAPLDRCVLQSARPQRIRAVAARRVPMPSSFDVRRCQSCKDAAGKDIIDVHLDFETTAVDTLSDEIAEFGVIAAHCGARFASTIRPPRCRTPRIKRSIGSALASQEHPQALELSQRNSKTFSNHCGITH